MDLLPRLIRRTRLLKTGLRRVSNLSNGIFSIRIPRTHSHCNETTSQRKGARTLKTL